ncbi:hypothetical protein DPMN_100490 [Dreissena polymorpha]|uniref:Uncharacterized protein n=1 Tax=Dreissena polymorpha TaxID=45954 RepID=A0A9D4LH13_DREPO|nr:hypothetical protein DPMN_100490 [Dreissena polymorpha]
MSVEQSSTYESALYGSCQASNAIDGKVGMENYDRINDTILCSMCSVMLDEFNKPPWWQVDMGNLVLAHSVQVYGRKGNQS